MPNEADHLPLPTTIANAVLLKPLDLWLSDSELWFVQAEALLTAQNITQQKTKLNHVD